MACLFAHVPNPDFVIFTSLSSFAVVYLAWCWCRSDENRKRDGYSHDGSDRELHYAHGYVFSSNVVQKLVML